LHGKAAFGVLADAATLSQQGAQTTAGGLVTAVTLVLVKRGALSVQVEGESWRSWHAAPLLDTTRERHASGGAALATRSAKLLDGETLICVAAEASCEHLSVSVAALAVTAFTRHLAQSPRSLQVEHDAPTPCMQPGQPATSARTARLARPTKQDRSASRISLHTVSAVDQHSSQLLAALGVASFTGQLT